MFNIHDANASEASSPQLDETAWNLLAKAEERGYLLLDVKELGLDKDLSPYSEASRRVAQMGTTYSMSRQMSISAMATPSFTVVNVVLRHPTPAALCAFGEVWSVLYEHWRGTSKTGTPPTPAPVHEIDGMSNVQAIVKADQALQILEEIAWIARDFTRIGTPLKDVTPLRGT